jgi:hypothetical protein
VVANQGDHVGQILGSKEIRTAAFELHPDQIGQTYGNDPVDLDHPPGRLVDEIPRHKLHGNPLPQELAPLVIELEPFRDQQIHKVGRDWIDEDINRIGRSHVALKQDGDPPDDDARYGLAAQELGQLMGQFHDLSPTIQEIQSLVK